VKAARREAEQACKWGHRSVVCLVLRKRRDVE